MFDDKEEDRRNLARRCAEAEWEQIREQATWRNFLKSSSLALICAAGWSAIAWNLPSIHGSVLGVVAILSMLALFWASVVTIFSFFYYWSAAFTVITPERFRPGFHFFAGAALTLILIGSYPYPKIKAAFHYAETHGIFVAGMFLVGALWFSYSRYNTENVEGFARYPLRWIIVIALVSLVANFYIPLSDNGMTEYPFQDRIGYIGIVLASYIGFYVGIKRGRAG